MRKIRENSESERTENPKGKKERENEIHRRKRPKGKDQGILGMSDRESWKSNHTEIPRKRR